MAPHAGAEGGEPAHRLRPGLYTTPSSAFHPHHFIPATPPSSNTLTSSSRVMPRISASGRQTPLPSRIQSLTEAAATDPQHQHSHHQPTHFPPPARPPNCERACALLFGAALAAAAVAAAVAAVAAADVAAADVAAADVAAVTAPWLPLLQGCCVPVSVSVCRCLCVCAYSWPAPRPLPAPSLGPA